MAQERLQKILAHAGVASRRAAEELIKAGRVRLNGRIVRELGVRADAHKDRVEIDGRRVVAEKPVYHLMHKPREMVTTLNDPEGRASLSQILGRVPERVYPVGRLDYHTSGALLITNDGDMADALLHPTKGVPKIYVAKMRGVVGVPALENLRTGVTLDDGYKTAPAEVYVEREERGNSWLNISIKEGKNRQIHRMGDAIGHRVMRLTRTSFAGLTIEELRPGQIRPLGSKEVDKLKKDYLNPRKKTLQNEREAAAAEANGEPQPQDDSWGSEVVSEFGARPSRGGSATSGARRGAPRRGEPRDAEVDAAEPGARRASGAGARGAGRGRAPGARAAGDSKTAARSGGARSTGARAGGARSAAAGRTGPGARVGSKPTAESRPTRRGSAARGGDARGQRDEGAAEERPSDRARADRRPGRGAGGATGRPAARGEGRRGPRSSADRDDASPQKTKRSPRRKSSTRQSADSARPATKRAGMPKRAGANAAGAARSDSKRTATKTAAKKSPARTASKAKAAPSKRSAPRAKTSATRRKSRTR